MSRISEMAFDYTANAFAPPPRSPLLMPEGIPPEVCVMFENYALQAWRSGTVRYSADAILHRIRWYHHVEKRNREFKANDHWTAPLARWFIAKHPDKKTFFEIRKLKGERNG